MTAKTVFMTLDGRLGIDMGGGGAFRLSHHLSLFSPGPSRRSDLQTLGYCMLKWLYGSLPWTNCLPNTEEITRQKQK